MNFADLGLSPEALKAVSEVGYTEPTPIQNRAIPVVLMGRDILGCAQTGTGKTASFTLPMVDILASGRARARMPRSLILTPTRELAAQIAESFERYGKYSALSMALLTGGTSIVEQQKRLDRGVDVLIATPGRLLDLFERGKILLADVKILVIDEADRMLDMGFIPDVERIVGLLPRIRQTLLFSATLLPEIRRLADAFLINPKEISVDPPTAAADTVTQGLVKLGGDQKTKRAALRILIDRDNVTSALIFCNRKRDVDIVYRSLKKHNYSVSALHGDMAQPARTATLAAFKGGEVRLLVCSDVAARGLDIPAVSHVFNFDVPASSEDYVHRIGRTGRAGRSGRAFTLALPAESRALAAVIAMLGQPIPETVLEGLDAWTGGQGAVGDRRRRRSPKGPARAPAKRAPAAPKPKAKTSAKPARPPESRSENGKGRKTGNSAAAAQSRVPAKAAAQSSRTTRPFGEHTPAFILRRVPIA